MEIDGGKIWRKPHPEAVSSPHCSSQGARSLHFLDGQSLWAVMLPYSLKIVWFTLSLSGMLSCWAVLIAYAAVIETYWFPVLYCIADTLMQGVFCLGLIWRMDPYLMPKAFCIAQTVIIGFSAFVLAGVATSFSIATTLCVLQPKGWLNGPGSALKWHPRYIAPLCILPVTASAVQISLILKLDAAQPSNDLHCDATHPLWVRFFGYAGIPFVLGIPCLYLSIVSVIRVCKTYQHLERARKGETLENEATADNFSPLPRRLRRPTLPLGRTIPSPSPSMTFSFPKSPGREPVSPILSARRFHLPFSPPPLDLAMDVLGASPSSTAPDLLPDEPDSPVSSAFPTFAPPSNTPTVNSNISEEHTPPEQHWQTNTTIAGDTKRSIETDRLSSLRWDMTNMSPGGRTKSEIEFDGEFDEIESIEDSKFDGIDPMQHLPHKFSSQKSRRPLPTLAPAIWRLILFQFAFVTVQALAAISTIVDVARGQSPTPFGTQHVALVLAGWGPVIIFGHLPAVRKSLMFWRR